MGDIKAGSSKVFSDGKAVARVGDALNETDPTSSGAIGNLAAALALPSMASMFPGAGDISEILGGVSDLLALGASGQHAAITDTGGYFAGSTVEAALQEIGSGAVGGAGGIAWNTIAAANVNPAADATGYIMETGGTLRTVTLPATVPAGFSTLVNASGGQVRIISNGNVIDGIGGGNDLLLDDGNTASLVAKATGSLEIIYGGTSAGTLPAGGTATQILTKASATDYDYTWTNPTTFTGDVTGTTALTLVTAQPAVHTWALAQTFTVAPIFTDQSGSRTALGLGTLATQSGTFSGTSSGTNTGDQTITLTGDVTGSGTGSFAASLATAQPTVHTWALAQTFTVAPIFTDQSGSRTALGLGTMATQTASNYALLAGPTFTGTPAAPTAAVDTNTTQLATTAFVLAQASAATPLIDGTATIGTSTKYAREGHIHPTDTTRAPLASPTFTGTPAAPTAAVGTSTTQLATTAFVKTPNIQTATTSVTLGSLVDMLVITGLTGTCVITSSAGTSNAQKVLIRIKDDGLAARTITWSGSWRPMGVALPGSTPQGKTMYLGFVYNVTDTAWDLIAKTIEA